MAPEQQPTERPTVSWTHEGRAHSATWRSEAEDPAPAGVTIATDATTADDAFRRVKSGEYLLYAGDFHNAKQLLASVGRRLESNRSRKKPASPQEAFRMERRARNDEAVLLSRILVPLDAKYKVALRRGPELDEACEPVWGPPPPGNGQTVVALRELLGLMGAAEWRAKGVEVEGLPRRIHPHYGVFSPTRTEYPELLLQAPKPTGKRIFDVGTGTGVLGLLLLARGAKEVVATDIDPRAVACATENAERLGFSKRFHAQERPLFPEGRADLVICNPPWIPEPPKTRIDRAIYDPEGAVVRGFLHGLSEHLEPGGQGWLILSDLPELLGLRPKTWLEDELGAAKLTIAWTKTANAKHPKAKDASDALYVARSNETTRLLALEPKL